jgi:hypothetical protein
MCSFGNAGTIISQLNLAKSSKARRLQQAQQAVMLAVLQGTVPPPLLHPDVLLASDFVRARASAHGSHPLANLYNVEHITATLNELQALIIAAKDDGRQPADVLADSHMFFLGPTGKTTVAAQFGTLFKDSSRNTRHDWCRCEPTHRGTLQSRKHRHLPTRQKTLTMHSCPFSHPG